MLLHINGKFSMRLTITLAYPDVLKISTTKLNRSYDRISIYWLLKHIYYKIK